MKPSHIFIAMAAAATLSACAAQQPATPDDFRQGVRNAGPMVPARVETFTVSRAHRDVTSIFRRNAKKCLAVTIRTTTRQGYSVRTQDMTYNPHVRVKGNRTEMVIRYSISGGIQIQTPPPGGYILMVVDATRIGGNKTRIDMYRPTIGHSAMIDGIRAWAKGTSRGCPDLTKSGL